MQKTIKARMFMDWEYGRNFFVIIDFNYDYAVIEEEVTFDGIKCYEYNSACFAMKPIKEKYNELSYFKYEDGRFMFFDSSGKDISSLIPKDMINTISFSNTKKVFRRRYVIDENLVLVRDGIIGINPTTQLEVDKHIIYTKDIFLKKYGVLPKKDYVFETIDVTNKV